MNWPCGVKGAGGRGGNTGIHKSVCVCVYSQVHFKLSRFMFDLRCPKYILRCFTVIFLGQNVHAYS